MAFFLIGRGADDTLQLLSSSSFESRHEAMDELTRVTSDPAFAQWDLEVFVVDLDAGVPVLLVRPQQPTQGEQVAAVEPTAEDSQPGSAEEAAESGAGLRDALQRTAEQMSAEGIVPPPSAGLGTAESDDDTASEEAGEKTEENAEPSEETLEAADETRDALQEPGESPEMPGSEQDAASLEQASEGASEDAAHRDSEQPPEQAWPWDAAPPAPAAEPSVSPEIASVYEGLEEMEASAPEEEHQEAAPSEESGQDGSDFILDLDAIQPVAMQPQGTDAAAPPPAVSGEDVVAESGEEPPAEEAADEPVLRDEEEPAPEPAAEAEFAASMTDYTCEDCVYVETCPNRDQREPKDCGSFQWK